LCFLSRSASTRALTSRRITGARSPWSPLSQQSAFHSFLRCCSLQECWLADRDSRQRHPFSISAALHRSVKSSTSSWERHTSERCSDAFTLSTSSQPS
jgi:hypothetical protein